ncbi:DNA mismatch repair endonuclease MutL [Dictyobacter aurantiacus]|uniref:DNA mismatch repair protein MutL n=1 Tax=Dictyobacter aurantiacus TaxID=1936993 RepID=A0A401ZCT5_9CHLR|nr:DNA mismatch repair endonuclease MutL [Dictyobacter aurantiacus]GCE04508.1 DNA mismatch repair protein MutL [Dictyobacter aurantiacus]
MPIRQLAPDVAAKIAAGEVVERPASVVKELIENSIDAGATQIRVDLTHGGLQLIRITDNGSGIPADELPLALTRHATSKVANIDDLENIRSLGFRGEALASIAAVAEVSLVSRPRGSEQGAQISAQSGQISDVTVAASPEGTMITVRNLFSAVPARLKFIKSRNTEVSHCHHLLEQYALAYPEIRFSVFSEGRQIFATPGDGQLASVLVEVYGLQIAEQMVQVQGDEQPEDPAYPIITGYTSRPTAYKSNRQHISFFVNRRWVLSRMLTSAVEGAYHSLLLTGRHPIAVINIQIDPSVLDVNVHPAKTEIRFLKERRVYASILRAVRAALLEEPEMPHWDPKQEEVAPQRSFEARTIQQEREAVEKLALDIDEETGEVYESGGGQQPAPLPNASSRRQIPADNPWMTVTEEESGTRPPLLGRLWQSHIHSPERAKSESGHLSVAPEPAIEERSEATASDPAAQNVALETMEESGPALSPIEQMWLQRTGRQEETVTSAVPTPVREPVQPPQQVSMLAASASPATESTIDVVDPHRTGHFPKVRVVGQVAQSYIVTEGEGGMYLIDQHAAHERILLERMVASLKARTPISQLLLTPIQLELSPNELEAIEDHQAQLEQIGFKLASDSHDGTLEVRAVPGVLVKQMNARSLHELLIELSSAESLGDTETWEERALANVACKAAIKANYFLTVSEMREMLEQLEQTRAPFSCCHGRPTMVHFGLNALARAFERR